MESILKNNRTLKDFPVTFEEKINKVIKSQCDEFLEYLVFKLTGKKCDLNQSNVYVIKDNKLNKHAGRCSKCKSREIFGAFYHCIICEEEFCAKCSDLHDHPMMKKF